MEYTTKSGYTLAEDMIEELTEAAARGDYPGRPGKIIVAPKDCTTLYGEKLATIATEVPRSICNCLDENPSRNA